MNPVQTLEQQGYKVKSIHVRKFQLPAAGVFYGTRREHPAIPPCPEGGVTVVVVRDNEGNVVARGRARCSDRDNYNKKQGMLIAAGRAYCDLTGETSRREAERRRRAEQN